MLIIIQIIIKAIIMLHTKKNDSNPTKVLRIKKSFCRKCGRNRNWTRFLYTQETGEKLTTYMCLTCGICKKKIENKKKYKNKNKETYWKYYPKKST